MGDTKIIDYTDDLAIIATANDKDTLVNEININFLVDRLVDEETQAATRAREDGSHDPERKKGQRGHSFPDWNDRHRTAAHRQIPEAATREETLRRRQKERENGSVNQATNPGRVEVGEGINGSRLVEELHPKDR